MKTKSDVRIDKYELTRTAKSRGMSVDEFVSQIRKGDNGSADDVEAVMKCTLYDLMRRRKEERHLRKALEIWIASFLAKHYDHLTWDKRGLHDFIRRFDVHFSRFNDDTSEFSLECARKNVQKKIERFKGEI